MTSGRWCALERRGVLRHKLAGVENVLIAQLLHGARLKTRMSEVKNVDSGLNN
jgi:hypothetical protein